MFCDLGPSSVIYSQGTLNNLSPLRNSLTEERIVYNLLNMADDDLEEMRSLRGLVLILSIIVYHYT